ncbi:MAG: ORF6N domain-containing protein [Bacteroidales bacterium]|nr:ORF6N domain-containing protein [Bacteroidales bacterium]
MKSQTVISSLGGRRKLPFAFTKHGSLMLAGNKILARKIEQMEGDI